jgi:hypothetical protein
MPDDLHCCHSINARCAKIGIRGMPEMKYVSPFSCHLYPHTTARCKIAPSPILSELVFVQEDAPTYQPSLLLKSCENFVHIIGH